MAAFETGRDLGDENDYAERQLARWRGLFAAALTLWGL